MRMFKAIKPTVIRERKISISFSLSPNPVSPSLHGLYKSFWQ